MAKIKQRSDKPLPISAKKS